MINQVESIEKFLRRAVRFVTNFKNCEPCYMTIKWKEINLPSLKEKREQMRWSLFRDIVKSDSVVKLSS